jgi:hypothetical protein
MAANPQLGARPHVVVETERLILRYLTADDIEAIFSVIGNVTVATATVYLLWS